MKLVVTGQDANGKSVVASNQTADLILNNAFPLFKNTALAAADQLPTLPSDGTRPAHVGFFPPPGGYRFFLFTIEAADPDVPAHVPTPQELTDAEALFPGLFSIYDDAGMERTDSIDMGYIVSGSVVLELDDGVEQVLHAGDAYVQNGTRHRWRNVGDQPVTMAVVILGTDRSS